MMTWLRGTGIVQILRDDFDSRLQPMAFDTRLEWNLLVEHKLTSQSPLAESSIQ